MKKIMTFASAIFALSLVGTVQTASAETLRVGMECTYAPFNYRTPEGELAGYDVDVAKGVANIIGADLEFVCQKWAGILPALLANKFDLVVASMSITESRLKKMDFSSPYRISVGRLVGTKDAKLNLFDAANVPIAASFDGLKVGIEKGSTYASWFKAKLPGADIKYYESNEALYLDLTNGRTDVIMTNPMKAYLKFLSKEGGSKFGFVSPQIDEKAFFGIGVGIGLRKGNDDLKIRLNAALETLTSDGSLEKYALKYFPFAIH